MIRVVDVRRLRTPEQRAGVYYCGRRFAGWPGSPHCNPFKASQGVDPLLAFRVWLDKLPDQIYRTYLADLWAGCEQGRKPLGCWCIDATHGDGQPVVCHAQVLAARLAERYLLSPEATDGLASAPATGAGDV